MSATVKISDPRKAPETAPFQELPDRAFPAGLATPAGPLTPHLVLGTRAPTASPQAPSPGPWGPPSAQGQPLPSASGAKARTSDTDAGLCLARGGSAGRVRASHGPRGCRQARRLSLLTPLSSRPSPQEMTMNPRPPGPPLPGRCALTVTPKTTERLLEASLPAHPHSVRTLRCWVRSWLDPGLLDGRSAPGGRVLLRAGGRSPALPSQTLGRSDSGLLPHPPQLLTPLTEDP